MKLKCLIPFTVSLILAVTAFSSAVSADESSDGTPPVTVYTFDIPPYSIHGRAGYSGAAYEIIRAVFSRAKIPCTVKLLPFSRAYRTTQTTRNSFFFPLSKMDKREKDFEWIGTIIPSPMSAFALESRTDIRIYSLDDMRNYRIGTVQNDARERYLLDHAFPLSSMQRLSGTDPYERNIRKLALGRIDILPIPDHVLTYLCRRHGIDMKIFRKAYRFEELSAKGYSLAASHGTNRAVIDKIRAELLRFKETPEYASILSSYGMSPR